MFLGIQAKSQPLDSLLQLVVTNNLELNAMALAYEAELEKVNQVSQLPNPQIGIGVPVLRPETRLGPQMMMVSVSQMFPWFGTLKNKENVVISMSKVKYEQIAAIRLNLFNRVKKAYYQIQYLEDEKLILNKNIELYKSIENVTLSKVESGQSNTADFLRIQIKLQEFDQRLKMIDNDLVPQYAHINEVTNLPWNHKVRVETLPNSLGMPPFDLADFQIKIRNHHPLITKINHQIEASENKQKLNANQGKPTIGFGVDYSLVGERTDALPINNGRDIFVPKLMVSVPLYRKGYKAKNSEEEKVQASLNMQKAVLENKMIRLLFEYQTKYDNAGLQIELDQKQIKTTIMAYEVLLSAYSATGKAFDDLLQIQNQLLGYELDIVQSKLKQLLAKADIERLTDY